MSAVDEEMIGRGAREGALLFRQWFDDLSAAANRGEKAAYVFVIGSMTEILTSFDMRVSFPEVNALQTAIRGVSGEYLAEAEDYGYSPDICGYVKADVALQLRNGRHPMGTIPKPAMAALTNGCNTYIKWAEIWERMYGIPVVTIDVPGTRTGGVHSLPGSNEFAAEVRYLECQIEELITVCEKVSGKRFDIDRFREVLDYANDMSLAMKTILDMNRSTPAVFNSLTDGTIYLGIANCFRGTREGSMYFRRLLEEMSYRVRHGVGIRKNGESVDQKFRLSFVGGPCYPIFRRFDDLFSIRGGVFVTSSYLWFASGGTCIGYEYDLDRPLESFAEGTLIMGRRAMDSMFHQDRTSVSDADAFALDGIVYHSIKSCRTVSTGLADQRRVVTERLGLPTLFLESDLMDPRVVSEAQMKNRIDAYFEGLTSRQQRAEA